MNHSSTSPTWWHTYARREPWWMHPLALAALASLPSMLLLGLGLVL